MPACFSCGEGVTVSGRVGRTESCSHCGADLHCCRNCEFYDPVAYNECRETQAERVVEKERSNFCDFFQLAVKPYLMKKQEPDAKKKLEELFRKK